MFPLPILDVSRFYDMCCSAFPRLRSHAPALGFLRDCFVPLCFSGLANRAPTKPNQVHSPAAPKSEPHAQAFAICPDRKNLVIMSGTMSEYMSDKVNVLYFEFPDRLHSRQNKSKHNAPCWAYVQPFQPRPKKN